MAPKSAANFKGNAARVQEAVDEFYLVSEMKYELAKTAYDEQDDETKRMIDQLVKVLNLHTTGYINVQLAPPEGAVIPVKITKQYVDYNTLYIVMDMLKTLAIFDIRVGKYIFPTTICAQCEAVIIPERKTRGKVKC